ncbi:hypothetical protein M1512_02075 [Patescibacteria group bacterium]|nr:hypothetical protein [Patescibacteria group bacterium]
MNKKQKILISIAFIILAVAIGVVSYYSFASKKTYTSTAPATPKSPPAIKSKGTNSSNSQQAPTTITNTQTSPSSAKSAPSSNQVSGSLETPYGQFVSNNSPSMGSYEESECETTPGASCYIDFVSSSGKTISLQTETTNSQGVAAWSWYVSSQMGFGPGTWNIQAIASLNGQTKTASSTMNVQQ